jgi:porin
MLRGSAAVAAATSLVAAGLAPAFADTANEPALAPAPISFGMAYAGEVAAVLAGGLDRGLVFLDRADLTMTVDGDVMGVSGLTMFLNGMGVQGGSPSEKIGDAQTASNIDADDTWKLIEAWVDYAPVEALSLRAGLYDLNSEFDAIETGAFFLHSSHGIGPEYSQSGRNGPSIFPTTGLGLRLAAHPHRDIVARAVVLDGVPGNPGDPDGTHLSLRSDEGALMAGELDYATEHLASLRLAAGAWYYTATTDDLVDVDTSGTAVRRNNHGGYLLAELGRLSAPSTAGSSTSFSVFTRYGFASRDVNRFAHYFGAGAVLRGVLGRSGDQVGLAVATAVTSPKFRRTAASTRAEIAWELGYRVSLARWLSVQPDVQVIINPGTSPSVGAALAMFLRVNLSVDGQVSPVD